MCISVSRDNCIALRSSNPVSQLRQNKRSPFQTIKARYSCGHKLPPVMQRMGVVKDGYSDLLATVDDGLGQRREVVNTS